MPAVSTAHLKELGSSLIGHVLEQAVQIALPAVMVRAIVRRSDNPPFATLILCGTYLQSVFVDASYSGRSG